MSIDYDRLRTTVDVVDDPETDKITRGNYTLALEVQGPDLARELLRLHDGVAEVRDSCFLAVRMCRDMGTPEHLADAGLLAPDLPEPRINIGGWQEWGHKHGNCVTLHNGMVTVEIPDDISRDLSPGEARELAAWLNAAATAADGADTK